MECTKGEWKHAGEGVIITEDGKQIASIFPRDKLANAHLIAAAPDMYEALKIIVNRLDEGLALGEKLDISLAREALSKAEGVENEK